VWVLVIVAAFFLWRSYKRVAAKLNVKLFGIGALIYLIGAILTIIFVGFILTFVAQIMFAIAFFSLPDNLPGAWTPPQTVGPSPPPPTQSTYRQPATSGSTYCHNCGAPKKSGANFCDHCGTRLG